MAKDAGFVRPSIRACGAEKQPHQMVLPAGPRLISHSVSEALVNIGACRDYPQRLNYSSGQIASLWVQQMFST